MNTQKALLFIALLPPLQAAASDGQRPTNAELMRAVGTLMNSPKAAAVPVQESVLALGAQAASMHVPPPRTDRALAQAQEEQQVHNRDEAVRQFEAQMAAIQLQIGQLAQRSNTFAQLQQGSAAENAAAQAIHEYATAALHSEQVIAQQQQYQFGAFAGLSAMVLGWVAKINPARVFRTSYRTARTRFTGIEIAAAASAAGSTAKSLLGPIMCAAAVGIVWWQFKSWIVQPYKDKHKREIEKFKEALEKHKKENAQAVEGLHNDMGNVRSSMGQALDGLRMHVKEQLTHAQEAHGRQIQELGAAQARTLSGVTDSNRQLQERLETEQKAFQAGLLTDQAEFSQVVTSFTSGLKTQFEHVQEDVDQMKRTNEQMKAQVDTAVGKLRGALQTMQVIKDGTMQQLTLMRGQKAGAKVADASGGDKKDKGRN